MSSGADALANVDNFARSEYKLYLAGRTKPSLATIRPGEFKSCPWCTHIGKVGMVRKRQNDYLTCDNPTCAYKIKLSPQPQNGAPVQIQASDASITFEHPNDTIGNNEKESNFGPLFCVSKRDRPGSQREHINMLRGRPRPRGRDTDLQRDARILEEREYHYETESGWTQVL
jgi:hypothetical protein